MKELDDFQAHQISGGAIFYELLLPLCILTGTVIGVVAITEYKFPGSWTQEKYALVKDITVQTIKF